MSISINKRTFKVYLKRVRVNAEDRFSGLIFLCATAHGYGQRWGRPLLSGPPRRPIGPACRPRLSLAATLTGADPPQQVIGAVVSRDGPAGTRSICDNHSVWLLTRNSRSANCRSRKRVGRDKKPRSAP